MEPKPDKVSYGTAPPPPPHWQIKSAILYTGKWSQSLTKSASELPPPSPPPPPHWQIKSAILYANSQSLPKSAMALLMFNFFKTHCENTRTACWLRFQQVVSHFALLSRSASTQCLCTSTACSSLDCVCNLPPNSKQR